MVHGCHIYKIKKKKKKNERKSNRYQEIFGGILLFMAFHGLLLAFFWKGIEKLVIL